MNPTALDTKLYITEAAESKLKAEAEKNIQDPSDEDVKALFAKHGITNERDGGTGASSNK
jgi:hypothetical protein